MATDELDSLFATPPPGFVEERKRIATALKSAGRKDEAKAVEKIPRPSLAVWTVNQVARRDPALVGRLGAVTDRLQEAAGADYAAAAAEHRQVLAELRRRAAEVLSGAGHVAGLQLVQRVIANLRAAVGNAETRAALAQGRLERDVEEQDVVSLFGAAVEAGPAPRGKPAAPATDTKAKAKATDAKSAAEIKAEERARAKEIADAEREVKRLRDAAAAAGKDAERAERAVAAAQEALAEADKRLGDSREARDASARALAEAESALARLTED